MSELKDLLINISEEKRNKVIPSNIKKGVSMFGIDGNYEGEVSVDEYNRVVNDMWKYYNNWHEAQEKVNKLEEQIETEYKPLITELGEIGDKVQEINGEGVLK